MIRLKVIAKRKGMTLKELADKIGITYEGLRIRQHNPTLNSLKQIAEGLDCEIHELFETTEAYSHFYDEKSKEWLGIRKK